MPSVLPRNTITLVSKRRVDNSSQKNITRKSKLEKWSPAKNTNKQIIEINKQFCEVKTPILPWEKEYDQEFYSILNTIHPIGASREYLIYKHTTTSYIHAKNSYESHEYLVLFNLYDYLDREWSNFGSLPQDPKRFLLTQTEKDDIIRYRYLYFYAHRYDWPSVNNDMFENINEEKEYIQKLQEARTKYPQIQYLVPSPYKYMGGTTYHDRLEHMKNEIKLFDDFYNVNE